MAASTDLSRWICFRFQILKPINAAAGSTMASSSVRSVFVRSVNRHFLSISQPRQILHSPLHWHDYKDLSGRVVKPSQMIVKSCKSGRCSTAVLTLLSLAGTQGGVLQQRPLNSSQPTQNAIFSTSISAALHESVLIFADCRITAQSSPLPKRPVRPSDGVHGIYQLAPRVTTDKRACYAGINLKNPGKKSCDITVP